jgi:hypothetical protein
MILFDDEEIVKIHKIIQTYAESPQKAFRQ